MNYNLIALDLDGTALSSNSEVQQSTIDAVRWVRQRGVRVVVSTGRIVGEAAEFAQQMGTDDPVVASGGAAIGSVRTCACTDRIASFPWETAAQAVAIVERANLFTMVYCGEQLFLTPYCDRMFSSYKKNEGFLSSKVIVPSVAEHIAAHHLDVDKLFSRCANPAILHLARQQLSGLHGIRVLSSAEDNLEAIAPNVNKACALKLVAERLGTDLAHTVAIGDSENDLEMLQAVGMPVAMGNAGDSVKKLAKHITSDNNHGGVAQAIYHLFDRQPD